MKTLVQTLTLMLVFTAGTALAVNITGAWKTITLDGATGDWTAADIMYPDDEITDGDPLTSTYYSISVCNDGSSIYVMLNTKGTGGADIMNAWARNLYIDNDNNPATGFNGGWMSRGYDRLVQYGLGGSTYSIYSFAGASQGQWAWNWLGTFNYSYSDNIIEWALPRSQVESAGISKLYMEFNVAGSGVGTETWAHYWEGGVSTYTVIPEPMIGAGLALAGVVAWRRRG